MGDIGSGQEEYEMEPTEAPIAEPAPVPEPVLEPA